MQLIVRVNFCVHWFKLCKTV